MTDKLTPKEALDYFNKRIKLGQCGNSTTQRKAFEAAIEALEKQVPKKPIKDGIDYAGNPIFCCPICGDNWNSNEFADGMECCWTCGQALDWSEESEERGE